MWWVNPLHRKASPDTHALSPKAPSVSKGFGWCESVWLAAGRGCQTWKGSGVAAGRGVERQWSKASAVVQSEKVRKAKGEV